MKEWFYRLRFKLAYWICPEYVDDIEERLSGLLCHTTGGLLGKTNYTLRGMITAVDDYQQRCCDECEYYLADHPTEKGCTGERCPMQVGYDVNNCKNTECIYRTEKGGEG